ncbi:SMP-30/gluconolactonase/LRE family protein [Celeribacter litoreus]|uniref:hypothetical protein n=1 Tax=Celeribacter litoreus TaxID=2876714 RepID=UPI001CCAA5F5|nr:hypothetical protein [Celeribacter litoreus]MCA0043404.1 hypothetical protein [Celeribacter litoreus]
MIGAVTRMWDAIRGTGDAALTVPAMDGAFMADTAIETADVLYACAEPDNLVATSSGVVFSTGGTILRVEQGGAPVVVEEGDASVTALAALSDGRVIVARSGAAPYILGEVGQAPLFPDTKGMTGDITALTVLPDGRVAATIGAEGLAEADWPRDFLKRGSTGSVWVGLPGQAAQRVAKDLAYPNGVVADDDGALVVSLAWRCALVRVRTGKAPETLLSNLPGYPARITRSASGGYWLSLFAPRNQFIEFVLREPAYVRRMIAEVDPRYWVTPRLSPEIGPLDPMLEGCTKKGSEIKPWAPSLSYGMVAHLRPDFHPDSSVQSRANGHRHGIRSAVEADGTLYIASRGGNVIVTLPTAQETVQ